MKSSAWLVSDEPPPRLQGYKLSYIEICYNIVSHPPAVISLRTAHKKHYGLRKPSVLKIMGRQHYHSGMSAYAHISRGCNGWPVSRHELLDATTHFTGA